MKVTFYSLGCKVNQYETESMREQLSSAGYDCFCDAGEADIVIVNSCTVTAQSDQKTRQILSRFRRMLPNAVIVLCGCMPAAFPEKSAALETCDIIFENSGDGRICDLLERYFKEKKKIVDIKEHKKGEKYNTPPISDFSERTRAFLKIEDGCDRFCSYCIIPKARGRVRSKPLCVVKSEVEALAKKGFCEVVLVGINLSAYGKGEDFNLCDAVKICADVPGIERVRLGSLEPDHMTDEMLCGLSKITKFCPQFHLSLQSGCDETLKRMNRHYDTAFYRDLITRIRRDFKDASITTDIMVGFSGETDEEFEKSLSFANEIGFAKAHIFAYSRRKGTVADTAPCQVTKAKKTERSHRMIEECKKSENEFLKSQLGRTFSVLCETEKDGFCEGYTENYTRVKFAGCKALCGKIVSVKLLSCEGEYIIGKTV